MTDRKKIERAYILNGESVSTASLSAECEGLVHKHTDGTEVVVMWEELSDEMKRVAGLFGLNTKIGNAAGGPGTPEMAAAVAEAIKSGAWSSERGVGAGINKNDYADAVERAKSAAGHDFDRDAFVTRLDDMEQQELKEFTASLRKIPQVEAALATIQAERKAERAAALADSSQNASADALGSL